MKIETRWRVLAALAVARIGMGFQFQTVPATAPMLAGSLGIDQAQIGWLVGLYLLPGIVFALPGGMLGARFGDKRIVLLGLALMALGGAGFALSSDIQQAVIARSVMGVGAVVLNVLLVKMVTDWFDGKEMVLAMSILMNSWPIGIGLALLTQGALAQSVSWQAAFGATAVLPVLGMLCVSLGYQPAPGAPATQRVDLRAFSQRQWGVIVIHSLPWMLYNAAYVVAVAFLPVFFMQTGMSLAAAGSFTAINTVLAIISVQAGGLFVQRYGYATPVVYLSLAGMALSLAGLVNASAPLPWIIAAGLFGGVPAGVLVSLPGAVIPAASRAAGMGVFYVIFYAGMALAPPLAGALALSSGSSAAPVWLAIACIVLCAATYAAALRLQRCGPAAAKTGAVR